MLKTRPKENCITITRILIEKMQERNTLKYSIVCNSTSPPQIETVQNKEQCPLKLRRLIDL